MIMKAKETAKGSEAKQSKPKELPLFYAPLFRSSLTLPPEESRHAARVLRLSDGDEVLVTDGAGSLCAATLLNVREKEIPLSLLSEIPESGKRIPPLTLAIAPTKNIDRIEWLLEKLTEVGLRELAILYSERSLRHSVNLERLEKVMISALKQSRKRHAVTITEHRSVRELLLSHASDVPHPSLYIGYCGADYPKVPITRAFRPGTPSLFLIGPEGDFSPEEVSLAVTLGAAPVTLGDERLRTETAGLYAGILHSVLNL